MQLSLFQEDNLEKLTIDELESYILEQIPQNIQTPWQEIHEMARQLAWNIYKELHWYKMHKKIFKFVEKRKKGRYCVSSDVVDGLQIIEIPKCYLLHKCLRYNKALMTSSSCSMEFCTMYRCDECKREV